jgi:hypothetical protein
VQLAHGLLSRVGMQVACCSASLGWACVATGLHHHLFVQKDLRNNLASLNLGDADAADAGRWLEWLRRDSPRVLADTFCACLSAMLLDGTWANVYWKMRVLVEKFVLGVPLAGVELLKTSAGIQVEPVPWAQLDRSTAERVWQDAAARGVVANLEPSAFGAASEPDDLYVVGRTGTIASGELPYTGSCPQTAELRAILCPESSASSFPEGVQEVQVVPRDQPPPCHYYCTLCNVTCNSEEQWLDHRNGQRHRRRIQVAVAQDGETMGYSATSAPPTLEDAASHEPNELSQAGCDFHATTFTPIASGAALLLHTAPTPHGEAHLHYAGGDSLRADETEGATGYVSPAMVDMATLVQSHVPGRGSGDTAPASGIAVSRLRASAPEFTPAMIQPGCHMGRTGIWVAFCSGPTHTAVM